MNIKEQKKVLKLRETDRNRQKWSETDRNRKTQPSLVKFSKDQ